MYSCWWSLVCTTVGAYTKAWYTTHCTAHNTLVLCMLLCILLLLLLVLVYTLYYWCCLWCSAWLLLPLAWCLAPCSWPASDPPQDLPATQHTPCWQQGQRRRRGCNISYVQEDHLWWLHHTNHYMLAVLIRGYHWCKGCNMAHMGHNDPFWVPNGAPPCLRGVQTTPLWGGLGCT